MAFSKDNSNAEYLYPILLPLRSDGVVVSATVASKAVCQLRGIPCGGFRGLFQRHLNKSYIPCTVAGRENVARAQYQEHQNLH